MKDLIHCPEPLLLFGHKQATEDPRDGLTLFGPLDEGKPYGIKAGVIGTKAGIEYFARWVEWVQRPVFTRPAVLGRHSLDLRLCFERRGGYRKPVFIPGLALDEEFTGSLYLHQLDQRVYGTVGVFSKRIHDAKREEEEKPEIWFVVVPDRVWKYCRPKSVIEPELRQQALKSFTKPKAAKTFYETRALFPEMEQDATPYVYEEQFHNQLKARLLDEMALTEIVRESTLANIGNPIDAGVDRRQAARQSEIAWNLCTAVSIKSAAVLGKSLIYETRLPPRGPGLQKG